MRGENGSLSYLVPILIYRLTDMRCATLEAQTMESNPQNRLQCHAWLATNDDHLCLLSVDVWIEVMFRQVYKWFTVILGRNFYHGELKGFSLIWDPFIPLPWNFLFMVKYSMQEFRLFDQTLMNTKADVLSSPLYRLYTNSTESK